MTAVHNGYKRLENFRRARLLFLKQYAGHYYDRDHGRIGTEPLNMIFNAIRVLVPNIVMAYPKHEVSSTFTAYRDYASLLELALDQQGKDCNIRNAYRRWLVDAIFTVGIMKTGLCTSGSAVHFDDDDDIDPGSVYSSVVDFDDFVMDARTHRFEEAAFLGNAMSVPRGKLLDSGLYNNALVEKLPRSGSDKSHAGRNQERSEMLSQRGVTEDELDFQDHVDIVELWVPSAKAVITVPRADIRLDKYLRVEDYYGPDEGPYTFLSLTQPVPNNPIPVASVGIWYDLHIMGNRMATKIMTQADRQKTVVGYRRSAADDAQEMVDARDGEAIAMDDPEGVKTYSFGGQERSNEVHMQQLELWFNMMSGNTEAMGGTRSDANTATQAQILQNNGQVSLEDMRDSVYSAAAEEAEKRMWYLHTDPLIEMPLIKRVQIPAVMGHFGGMPRMTQPARIEEQQVILTPEARRGDFLDFHTSIKMRSMSRMDPALKQQRTMEFLVKVIPAVTVAAQQCAMLGVPMSPQAILTRVAQDMDIEWFDEVFADPVFQQQVMALVAASPGMQGSQGSAAGVMQNGQPGNLAKVPSPSQQQNRGFQMPAAGAQSGLQSNERY
jgi:hypothetical protein